MKKRLGKGMPYGNYGPASHEPLGDEYDFDDENEAARRLPKLHAKYPEMGD
jgi:hypothetical protein